MFCLCFIAKFEPCVVTKRFIFPVHLLHFLKGLNNINSSLSFFSYWPFEHKNHCNVRTADCQLVFEPALHIPLVNNVKL